ncbi:MAG: hypothetical protein JST30_00435 [Armatimonadetes bacterium]|nr:hypothetical protein [Armatimonadota bacterium]
MTYGPYGRLVRGFGRQRLPYAARNLRTGRIEIIESSRTVREDVAQRGTWSEGQKKAA